MASRYMKKFSASLITRETQGGTTMSPHTWQDGYYQKAQRASIVEDTEEREPLYTALLEGMQINTAIVENHMAAPQS